VGLAHYGTVLVLWYVVHSHERRLAGSMIEEEFEVCFELLLSLGLAKRRLQRLTVRAYLPVPCSGGGAKKFENKSYGHLIYTCQ
jgi:hypothetical protein